MIKELEIQNFKGIKYSKITGLKDINLFIGKNKSKIVKLD